jgi:hypothetical protein
MAMKTVQVGVHVMADPTIGGVMREYREVARKADVGESIKITVPRDHRVRVGEVYEVIEVRSDCALFIKHPKGWNSEHGGANIYPSNYVVLEPTDVVVIDNARYQLAESGRAAQEGEKVLVVDAKLAFDYANGDVIEVIDLDEVKVAFRDRAGDRNCMWHSEYRALLPIADDSQASADESAPTATLHTNLGATIEVSAGAAVIAQQIDSMRKAEFDRGVAEGIAMERARREEDRRKLAQKHSRLVENAKTGGVSDEKVSEPPNTRAEIVEMAKVDVERLLKSDEREEVSVKFRINREFRTVVVETRDFMGDKARFYATCAPGDVFNAHIGMAIALRRALGLDVPREYLNAPEPTEAQVGDVVVTRSSSGVHEITSRDTTIRFRMYGEPFLGTWGSGWLGTKQFTVIDDTRDGYVYDVEKWRAARSKHREKEAKVA